MKLDTIPSLSHRHVEYINHDTHNAPPAEIAKRDERAAEPEVASLYYLTTMQSLKDNLQPTFTQTKQTVEANEHKKTEKRLLHKIKDWLWGVFGFNKNEASNVLEVESDSDMSGEPLNDLHILEPPDPLTNELLNKCLVEINQVLDRLKENFDDDIRNVKSKKLDKWVFERYITQTLLQRDLKQANSILAHQEINRRRKVNDEIQKTTNTLSADLITGKKWANSLGWLNITVSGSLVFGTALAFFTGGGSAVIAVALPLASILKGGTTLSEGLMKYSNSKKEGELMLYKEEARNNTSVIHDEIDVVNGDNEAVAHILQSLRKQLQEQSQTERLFARIKGSN